MGLMQDDFPLNLQHVRRRMRDVHPQAEVVTLTGDDGAGTVRASFAEISARVDRLARALGQLGIEPGDRVGTFAWNNQRHFELYMAVPVRRRGSAHAQRAPVRRAARLHRQPRRGPGDLRRRLARAAAGEARPEASRGRALRRDGRSRIRPRPGDPLQTLPAERAALRGAARRRSAGVEARTAGAERARSTTPRSTSARPPRSATRAARPATRRACSTRTARSACTRPPRCSSTTSGSVARDRALVIVPMFHVNAWGLPYAAALAGAELLMPDRFLQAEPLARAIERERPTVAGCVPTIFADLLRYADAHEVDLSSLTQRRLRGLGRAAPADEGLRGAPRRAHLPGLGDDRDEPRRHLLRARRGLRHAGTTSATGTNAPCRASRCRGSSCGWSTTTASEVPWDGESTGEIEVRGPWIAARYFDDPSGDEKFDSRLAAHRRHRGDRRARLRADHRPREGRDQVRRRVDLLGRARERGDGPPRRDRGGGDRQARRALVRAPAVLRGAARGGADERRGARRAPDAGASRSGGCRTSSRSSRRFRRRASASSTRRCCAASWPRARWRGACGSGLTDSGGDSGCR